MFQAINEAARQPLIRRTKVATRNFITLCLFVPLTAALAPGQDSTSAVPSPERSSDVKEQVVELRAVIEKLQARVEELEKRSQAQQGNPTAPETPASGQLALPASASAPNSQNSQTQATEAKTVALTNTSDFLHGTTLNLFFDGYYGYNFNNPIGRTNLLRAYDVSSNAFSINQAGLVVENAADPINRKRFGFRLDFQYGQATETTQGNPGNEPRPEIYRNIFQAYGTYVVPVGKGLTLDFGKFASSLGIEGNYTKDQINYSRAYWFSFLPFYHMGIRANYKINDMISVNYWIVNGTQQTEPFNGFKDQFIGVAIQPTNKISWNVNYYLGQEHADVMFFPNGGAPAGLPTQQGVPFQPIVNSPGGKLHILDSYLTWQMMPKLTLALEGDYVIQRLFPYSAPSHTLGGAGYLRYQSTPRLSIAGRAEYLSDRGGLFTGKTQAVKEATFTTNYAVADGFHVFGEWRRDFSNQPYFLTDILGSLKKEQNTATIGLVWWLGGKQGNW